MPNSQILCLFLCVPLVVTVKVSWKPAAVLMELAIWSVCGSCASLIRFVLADTKVSQSTYAMNVYATSSVLLPCTIGVARGCRGCRCTPQGDGKKFFVGNFYWNGAKVRRIWRRAPPADEILVAYITDMTMQKVMTKKRKVMRFLVRKSAPPQRKSWLCLCHARK